MSYQVTEAGLALHLTHGRAWAGGSELREGVRPTCNKARAGCSGALHFSRGGCLERSLSHIQYLGYYLL